MKVMKIINISKDIVFIIEGLKIFMWLPKSFVIILSFGKKSINFEQIDN